MDSPHALKSTIHPISSSHQPITEGLPQFFPLTVINYNNNNNKNNHGHKYNSLNT